MICKPLVGSSILSPGTNKIKGEYRPGERDSSTGDYGNMPGIARLDRNAPQTAIPYSTSLTWSGPVTNTFAQCRLGGLIDVAVRMIAKPSRSNAWPYR
jgi:hypothetical protein